MFDIFFSILALIILAPLFIVISIIVKIDLGSPIIFKQERVGKDNKKFILYKFRTMKEKTNENEYEASDEYRLTKLGTLIRKMSLDELPQLINILKGDMSFIGPRPLVLQYLAYYTKEELKRHNVRPGLSGLAQITGRSNLQWEERFQLDIKYVDNISFSMDLKILLRTIKKVFSMSDIEIRGKGTIIDFDVYRKENQSNK